MCSKMSQYIRLVTMNTPNYTNMLSSISEGNEGSIYIDWRYDLGILSYEFTTRWRKSQQFSFLGDECDRVPLTVLQSQQQQVLEVVDAVSHQDSIVSLANAGGHHAANVSSKLGVLGWL